MRKQRLSKSQLENMGNQIEGGEQILTPQRSAVTSQRIEAMLRR
jgi:hypothetical protein